MFATTKIAARRAGAAAVTAVAIGGAAVLMTGPGAPAGQAAPDPCAASEVAKTAGAVATNTGSYLDTHPQTNQALTLIAKQQGGAQSLGALKSYLDANPLVQSDLQRLQQPLVSLAARCQLPVTLPQVLGLMQVAAPGAAAAAAPVASPAAPAAQSMGAGAAEAAPDTGSTTPPR
ncbi:hemophore [Mycolicibacterium sp. 018/SC-01/001]|uniref:hemophore n=1 Tax=Mycolicibacterium sp. 018/SC-01/001 TaxID=2592069 RepID=UPI00117F3C9D|nr:hemophore [Mycolicibacterium sp. 018/SC-01/001]TRW87863.1 hemophore [Mycolicibacterium sp. 018/SC-01/001]